MEFEKYTMIYRFGRNTLGSNEYRLNIFNEKFVETNKNKAILKIRNKKYFLTPILKFKYAKQNQIIKIESIFFKNLSNKSYMFKNCNSLTQLSIDENFKTSYNIPSDEKIESIGNEIYSENKENGNLLKNIVDANNHNNLFYENCNEISLTCYSEILPKGKTGKNESTLVYYKKTLENKNFFLLNGFFENCTSLSSLKNVSLWNYSNILDMHSMFKNCPLLSSLPDISKWSTEKVTDMSKVFYGCKSLISLPEISKWKYKKCK